MKTVLLFFVIASRLGALTLSDFSCQRPAGVDGGTWHNVSLAVSLVNGTVVAPGQEFSFLKVIAPGSGHWRPGNTLFESLLVKSLGGGYCQVSTSIYNAALLAGLPITQRYNHSFYDSADAYVEPGLDAAVSGSDHADFCFLNSTRAALRILAEADDGKVHVRLEGQGTPRHRWVTTDAQRIPMQHIQVKEGLPKRPGYDGWIVKRFLKVLDDQGNTRTINLGTDSYQMITAHD